MYVERVNPVVYASNLQIPRTVILHVILSMELTKTFVFLYDVIFGSNQSFNFVFY